jgi:hypothetical protein
MLLWGLTAVWALILRHNLKEAAWLWRLYGDASHERQRGLLVPGTSAPQFSCLDLNSGVMIEATDLSGHTLMFVSPAQSGSTLYLSLLTSIRALLRRTQGKLCIVCSGGLEECRSLVPRAWFSDRFGTVPVLLDKGGDVARAFRVLRTPVAISLDRDGRIERYGFQREAAGTVNAATKSSHVSLPSLVYQETYESPSLGGRTEDALEEEPRT